MKWGLTKRENCVWQKVTHSQVKSGDGDPIHLRDNVATGHTIYTFIDIFRSDQSQSIALPYRTIRPIDRSRIDRQELYVLFLGTDRFFN